MSTSVSSTGTSSPPAGRPPFFTESFDLVYCLGVIHHLEDPLAGVRSLAGLVRPRGELRLYVYRSLEDDTVPRRLLLGGVTQLRGVTTRMPFPVLHAFAWFVAFAATVLFLVPRRLLRRWGVADRQTGSWPLAQYTDVPFRMLVAEQFDRFGAPIERRFRREDVEGWVRDVGFGIESVLSGLGWRVAGRRPG